MSVAIIMPFQSRDEHRFRSASWVNMRFQSLHPEWPVIVATEAKGTWAKGRAVNLAAKGTAADILIITDADVAVPAKALEWAVAAVEGGAAWSVPFGLIYRLHQDATAARLAEQPDGEITAVPESECLRHRPPYEAVPGGGIFVVARDAWEKVQGYDPRFLSCQEDASLGHCLDTLAGPHELLPAPLWHLWHEPRVQSTQMYDDQRLEARYLAARGKAPAMRRLVRERASGLDVSVTQA